MRSSSRSASRPPGPLSLEPAWSWWESVSRASSAAHIPPRTPTLGLREEALWVETHWGPSPGPVASGEGVKFFPRCRSKYRAPAQDARCSAPSRAFECGGRVFCCGCQLQEKHPGLKVSSHGMGSVAPRPRQTGGPRPSLEGPMSTPEQSEVEGTRDPAQVRVVKKGGPQRHWAELPHPSSWL